MKFNRIIKILALIIIAISIPNFLVLASNNKNIPNTSHLVRLTRVNYLKLIELKVKPLWTLDYGNDIWLEVQRTDFMTLEKSAITYHEGSYILKLGGIEFDPLTETSSLPSGWEAINHPENDLYLIQFYAPTRDEWLESLRSIGIEIVQYIHPFTYVVWGDSNQIQQASSQGYVRWSGTFAPVYRVQPELRTLAEILYSTNILFYRGGDVNTAIDRIQGLGAQFIGRKILNNIWEIGSFLLPGHKIKEAAGIVGVYSIQLEKTDGGLRGEMSDQINVNNHGPDNQAFPGYLPWLSAAGVDGSGIIIANVDGGVQNDHPDLINRLIPCIGDTCGGTASDDHGTHTAGIMAADGSSGVLDSYGFLRGLGMAPGANLVEQVYFPWYQQPGGMLLLMTESYNNGASLSGNSWGPSGTPQGYDDDTLQVDIGVRDADPNAPGSQPFSYILSIMNGNGGYQTQGTPDEAKNIFTIGSTKMQQSGGQQYLEINNLSANTAHGPALDGRNIPHMVAPGCYVDSTRYPGPYGTMCGTSMASPHVSGAVAVFIEYYLNLFAVDPSPAMVKAAFLPVAHDLAGNLDADGVILGHPFDYKQGWGRMDTAAVVSPTVEVIYFDNPIIFDNTGETWIQSFSAIDPTKPVRMMLVWTDAPGHGLGGDTPAWNNDLDLVATVGGETIFGNDFDSNGWSQSGGVADYMNNTEGIFLGPTPPDSFAVQVVAANINSDGVSNFGDDTDQDFALVCYNCTLGADFTLSAEPESQSVCAPDPAVYELAVEVVGPFSSAITLSTLGEPEGTTVEFSSNPVVPSATAILTVGNTISATTGIYSIDILGVGTTQTHTATVGLSLFDSPPGVFGLLEPADRSTEVNVQPVFGWTAAEQAETYTLEIAHDHEFEDVVVVVSDLISPSHALQGMLDENQLYFWRVIAHNVCGNVITEVNSFSTVTPVGSCPIGTTAKIAFTADFEDGDSGWTHGGLVDTWALSAGDDVHYFADDVAYVSDQLLFSPQIELPDEHNKAYLSFWNYQSIQDLLNGCADAALVEVSADGGNSWTAIDDESLLTDPYDGIVNGSGNPLQGQAAWCGDPQDWVESVIELDDYLGEQVQLRFRLGTDSTIGHNGWGVDDVQVRTCEPTTLLERESVLSGLPGSVVVHRFELDNLGETETYHLSVSGHEWETTLLSDNPLSVSGGMTTTVEIAVRIPELMIETVHGMDGFTITAVAENMPVLEIAGQGTTLAETHSGVELTPEMQSGSVQSGGEVSYVFELTNLGDYTDTFSLNLSGDWILELPGGNMSEALGSGKSVTVEVVVTAPMESQSDAFGLAVLQATSTLDNAVSASASATTYLWYQNYLPLVRR